MTIAHLYGLNQIAIAGWLRAAARRLAAALGEARRETRTRAALAGLDRHLLRDIGFDAEPTDATLRRRLRIG